MSTSYSTAYTSRSSLVVSYGPSSNTSRSMGSSHSGSSKEYRVPENTYSRGPVNSISSGSNIVHNQQARYQAQPGMPLSRDATSGDYVKSSSSKSSSSKSSKSSRR